VDLPAVVFLGFGIIDILFKQVALFKEVPYTTSLFLIYTGICYCFYCADFQGAYKAIKILLAAYDVWLDIGRSQFW
jgi:hypothetical protein